MIHVLSVHEAAEQANSADRRQCNTSFDEPTQHCKAGTESRRSEQYSDKIPKNKKVSYRKRIMRPLVQTILWLN